jgi:hypothetical protein
LSQPRDRPQIEAARPQRRANLGWAGRPGIGYQRSASGGRCTCGKTVIAIAHRLSTIARMDRLVVLDRGRIVETGSHAELTASGGLYARLWARQTGGFVTG